MNDNPLSEAAHDAARGAEPRALRVKRMKIRAWRRGIKEMDLILGGYADAHLATMSEAELDAFDALMTENDQDLYQWVSGQAQPPAEHAPLIARLARR